MKNTIYIIIVIILIVAGVYFFNSKSAEAPEVEGVGENTEEAGAPITNKVPVPGSDVEEKIVVDASVGISAVKEFTVEGKNFSFTPSTITVKKGDKVKITFKNTEGFHDFKIDAYGVATKQAKSPAEEVLEFTADKAGSFEYYCSVGSHKSQGMKGTLVVQ